MSQLTSILEYVDKTSKGTEVTKYILQNRVIQGKAMNANILGDHKIFVQPNDTVKWDITLLPLSETMDSKIDIYIREPCNTYDMYDCASGHIFLKKLSIPPSGVTFQHTEHFTKPRWVWTSIQLAARPEEKFLVKNITIRVNKNIPNVSP